MFLVFQWTKGNSLCVFILWGINRNSLCVLTLWRLHGNSLCIFTLWWINSNRLIPVVLKFTTCWFWRFLPWYQSWSPICFSADTYMANREWGPPMPISPCNDRERWRWDGLSHFHYSVILAYYYCPLTVRESQLPSPQPGKCIRVSYFLVTICWTNPGSSTL